ncbi:MAG: SufD family Fe-S cluster assembly protein [Campylobacterota bacterium]
MRPSELSNFTSDELLASLHLNKSKEAVAKRFLELGMPGNKTEQYKSFSVKPLLQRDYTLVQTQQKELQTAGEILEIRDGVVTSLPEGADITFTTEGSVDMTHFDALYYMGHLLSPRYIVVNIKSDVDITIVHHITLEQTLIPYRIIIKIAESSQVQVYETFHTENSQGSLLLYGLDVHLNRDSMLTWLRNQTATADEAVVIGSHHYDIGERAKLTIQTFDFGSGTAMHLYNNDLAAHTETRVSHLLFASAKARRGNVVMLRHNGVSATSRHLAKSILKDNATGIFDGRIQVNQSARYAKTSQNSKAILLNNRAFMKSKPQLEIYIDELEASHGSTIGQLDEAALFYLCSRGITTDEARKMLILAFANEMIEEVQETTLSEQIGDGFESAYHTQKDRS